MDPDSASKDSPPCRWHSVRRGTRAEEALTLFQQLRERAEGFTGVQSVSAVDALPMTLLAGRRRGVSIPGYEPADGEDMEFQFHAVGPDFMRTMEMEVLAGREFNEQDVEGAPLVAMVNETFAERFWPGESPLGRQVQFDSQPAEVVGLVADAMYRDLRDVDRPAFFIALRQNPATGITLVTRADDPERAEALLASLRDEVGRSTPSSRSPRSRPWRTRWRSRCFRSGLPVGCCRWPGGWDSCWLPSGCTA